VTLFEDRAEVVRGALVSLTPGVTRFAIAGVSHFIDERSVQARVLGEEPAGRILSASVRYHAHVESALGHEAMAALEAEARSARGKIAEVDAAGRRAEAALVRARTAFDAWVNGARTVPLRANEPDRLANWQGALSALQRAEDAALDERAKAQRALASASDEHARAEARLAAGRVEQPRFEATIEVEVEASAPAEATIEVRYRVPVALWRPEHLIRLVDPKEGAQAALEIVTYATAWQRTGESWDEVDASVSTARPAQMATPPLLTDDVLSTRRKTTEERRRVEVDMREQDVAMAGVAGARAVDEMPGVDDGGEPALLTPKGKVTIRSDGLPFRVEVGRKTLTAKVERVVLAEVATAAHLSAKAVLTGGAPLLAGPVRIARGASLVGRSRVAFVGVGEPFEIGLGPDDSVRVRRTDTEERDSAALTGTQKRKHTVKVHLSNLSNETKRIVVTERIPVSEIEDVQVAIVEAGGFRADGPDGMLRVEAELAGGATRTLELVYELRAASKVVLPP
jgi:uncharacterized protein (TIGR02231 family)